MRYMDLGRLVAFDFCFRTRSARVAATNGGITVPQAGRGEQLGVTRVCMGGQSIVNVLFACR